MQTKARIYIQFRKCGSWVDGGTHVLRHYWSMSPWKKSLLMCLMKELKVQMVEPILPFRLLSFRHVSNLSMSPLLSTYTVKQSALRVFLLDKH